MNPGTVFLYLLCGKTGLYTEALMKITRCKRGHYYDKSYFRQCPHCHKGETNEYWAADGWDENVQSESDELPGTMDKIQGNDEKKEERFVQINNQEKREDKAKKKYKKEDADKEQGNKGEEREDRRWGEEEEENSKKVQKNRVEFMEENIKKKRKFMIMASMPAKPVKNQEFCIDFCVISQNEWKTGADMLVFKNREGSRDIKLISLNLPTYAMIRIQYKNELLFVSEELLFSGLEMQLFTFPVTVTDNRDRRFHKIQVEFVVEEEKLQVPLYLIPQN